MARSTSFLLLGLVALTVLALAAHALPSSNRDDLFAARLTDEPRVKSAAPLSQRHKTRYAAPLSHDRGDLYDLQRDRIEEDAMAFTKEQKKNRDAAALRVDDQLKERAAEGWRPRRND